MKLVGMPLEVEVNVTNYPDVLINQDIDNDIITLRQPGLSQRIIDTLHLDNDTLLFTLTYSYSYLLNGKLLQGPNNYLSTVGMPHYVQSCFCNNFIYAIIIIMIMLSVVSQLHPWTNEGRSVNKVVSQTFCYTSYLTSSYEAAPKQTIQHLKQVTFTIYCIWLATIKTKNNTHINLALT